MLTGKIATRSTNSLIIDVHGVGYKVLVSPNILSSVHDGEEKTIFIYHHIREDLSELYGFISQKDLALFEKLIGVSGVGPKTALGVFTVGSSDEILRAVMQGDVDFFSGVPRLGKKNAQKIIIELKGKLDITSDTDLEFAEGSMQQEILMALEGFGFTRDEGRKALQKLGDEGETTADKVRLALKYLGR